MPALTGRWEDAQALALEHSDTFHAPTAEELDSVATGWIVKISDGKERFWVEVESRQGSELVGYVNNELLGNQAYSAIGSSVRFELRHIYEIDTPQDIEAKAAFVHQLMTAGLSPEAAFQMLAELMKQ